MLDSIVVEEWQTVIPSSIGQTNVASSPSTTLLTRNQDSADPVFQVRNLEATATLGDGLSGEASSFGAGVRGVNMGTAGGPGVVGSGVNGSGVSRDSRIDHPLDPKNKYLLHNAVESSERKNVYDGVVRLDKDGAAEVELPEWFEALNGDFRYQLTAVGGAAPGLHVAEEISANRFKIAGGEEGMKVCWQVTGSRKDPWAAAHPFEVEQEKREKERGRYLDPSLYNAPEEQRVMREPIDESRRLLEEQRRAMEKLRRQMERPEEAPLEST